MKPIGLTIAGSDSGGGAGLQADIKSMEANGVFAASVVVAVTAQNTKEVAASHDLPIDLIAQQIDTVMDDLSVDVIKTGMLSSRDIITTVGEKLRKYGDLPLVVDPVMISKSGYALLQPTAVESLKREILPEATVVTPNAHEAGELTGLTVETVDEARKAAAIIQDIGAEYVLVKGGHLVGEERAVDVLYDGEQFEMFSEPFIDTPHTHGTGCTYASAIAAELSHGKSVSAAVHHAKKYITEAIRNGLPIGSGHGPPDHFYFLDDYPPVDID
jgi:hydroxymethylpyrimidine/phosphomethylpyrimidine kinase